MAKGIKEVVVMAAVFAIVFSMVRVAGMAVADRKSEGADVLELSRRLQSLELRVEEMGIDMMDRIASIRADMQIAEDVWSRAGDGAGDGAGENSAPEADK